MKKIIYLFILIPIVSLYCQEFDLQGHRGCRGLLPENSIAAMKKAIAIGVTTLEMDVVISKDNKVLLSHEPFLSHEICTNSNNQAITTQTEKSYNLYQMDYSEIKKCDCGSTIHPRFATQAKIKTYKPLLAEVIDSIENYVAQKYPNKKIYYNIETKTTPDGDGIYHPKPKAFVDLLAQVIESKNISNRVFIQSFDVRTLQYIKAKKMPYKIVLLVENNWSVLKNIKNLGFNPSVYSPDYTLLSLKDVNLLHTKNILVIPWTVNTISAMRNLIAIKVDGIITDYPDNYFKL